MKLTGRKGFEQARQLKVLRTSQKAPFKNDLDFPCNPCCGVSSSQCDFITNIINISMRTNLYLGCAATQKTPKQFFGEAGNRFVFRQNLPWRTSECQLLSQLSLFQTNTKVILMLFLPAQQIKICKGCAIQISFANLLLAFSSIAYEGYIFSAMCWRFCITTVW